MNGTTLNNMENNTNNCTICADNMTLEELEMLSKETEKDADECMNMVLRFLDEEAAN